MSGHSFQAAPAATANPEKQKPSVRLWLLGVATWMALLAASGVVRDFAPSLMVWTLLVWCLVGIAVLGHTIRVFIYTPGLVRKLLIAGVLPVALPATWTLRAVIMAPPWDAEMIEQFERHRPELEAEVAQGESSVFVQWSRPGLGPINHGIEKGYVHTETRPSPLLDNLDRAWMSGVRELPLYRHISGNWYLFLGRN